MRKLIAVPKAEVDELVLASKESSPQKTTPTLLAVSALSSGARSKLEGLLEHLLEYHG